MTQILNTITLYQDKFFKINCDEIDLNNGKIGKFEYADSLSGGMWAVMVIPIDNEWCFYFVSMFQVGTWVDTITFPKWGMKQWMTHLQVAQEELQEEIGMKAHKLVKLWELYSHPWRAKRKHNIILAQWLSPSKLEWDEIETIKILKLTQEEIETMIMNWEINDAKTVASFYMAITYLSNN